MRSHQLQESITRALGELVSYADELRDLDQALGDGDLGITVSLGAKAVIEALEALPTDAPPTEIARTCAKAFANALNVPAQTGREPDLRWLLPLGGSSPFRV